MDNKRRACTRCFVVKDPAEFVGVRGQPVKTCHRCRETCKKYNTYRKQFAKEKGYKKAYNPEKAKAYRLANKDKYNEACRRYRAKRKQFNEEQMSVCE